MVHDAVLLWAYGLNKSLEEGYAADDGISITKNIINMSFPGITGQVIIDGHGDRLPDYNIQIVQGGEMKFLLKWVAVSQS